jgi:hypothetical protein
MRPLKNKNKAEFWKSDSFSAIMVSASSIPVKEYKRLNLIIMFLYPLSAPQVTQ